eukprot:SAG22_NODE_556_length_9120_cov_2.272475_3_plen_131_part_00
MAAPTHTALCERARIRWAAAVASDSQDTNPDLFQIGSGRVLFPHLPELSEVLAAPTLRGAVGSLLGHDYVQHPHRSMHHRTAADQDFHRDGSHCPVRHTCPHWLIVFYYPGEVTAASGPSLSCPAASTCT